MQVFLSSSCDNFYQGVELQLKHVHSASVFGWSNVCETIIGEWLEDISQNQVFVYFSLIPEKGNVMLCIIYDMILVILIV